MATVYVNDKPVDVGGDKLNLIQAALRGGVFIPHYCWHPALTVVASCRMCLVEVGERKPDGTVAMQPKVVPGCQTPAKDGTVIVTNSPKAKAAQAGTLEDLLLNHKLATNVVDLCPVGALCSKDFLYKHRVWNLRTQNSVCADCSTGCSIYLDGNKDIVYRLRPRYNPQAQGHFMCDDGRLGYH